MWNKDKVKEYNIEYYKNNQDKILEYRKNHKDEISVRRKKYYQKNKEKELERCHEYYKKNRDQLLVHAKEYSKDNQDVRKEYREKNRSQISEKRKEYYRKNKEKEREYKKNNRSNRNEYEKRRKQTDLMYKLSSNIRGAIWRSLKSQGISKNGRHWETLVGYTIQDLKIHLEKQFKPWMNWDNYGKSNILNIKWSLDHIIPLSVFNFTSIEDPEFKLAWALDNLQPLDDYINKCVKKDRLDYYIENGIEE
jgi:hypothetical protein